MANTKSLIKTLRWSAENTKTPFEANLAYAAADRLEKLEAENEELKEKLRNQEAAFALGFKK